MTELILAVGVLLIRYAAWVQRLAKEVPSV